MIRPVCLQIYISRELSARIREAAKACDLSVSHWAMSRLYDALDDDDFASCGRVSVERIARQGVFSLVALDALLVSHSDPHLRERVHGAYTRKCRELGLSRTSERPRSEDA